LLELHDRYVASISMHGSATNLVHVSITYPVNHLLIWSNLRNFDFSRFFGMTYNLERREYNIVGADAPKKIKTSG